MLFTEVHTEGGSYHKGFHFWARIRCTWIKQQQKTTRDPDTGRMKFNYGGTNTVESLWWKIKRKNAENLQLGAGD